MGKPEKKLRKRLLRELAKNAHKFTETAWGKVNGSPKVAGRDCATCKACPGTSPCAWREGWMQDAHRPDIIGLRVDGQLTVMPGEGGRGTPLVVTTIQELREGARDTEGAVALAKTFGQVMPVAMLDMQGQAFATVGFPTPPVPEGPAEAVELNGSERPGAVEPTGEG